MKNKRNEYTCRLTGLLLGCVFLFGSISMALAMDEPGFSIHRMVVAASVMEREPVEIRNNFSESVKKVYCFLEARDIEQDTTVSFVWLYEGDEVARVPLALKKGPRWRTYASKRLGNRKGSWQVELVESSGIVLNTVSFTVN